MKPNLLKYFLIFLFALSPLRGLPAEALLPEAYRGPNEVRTTAPAEAPLPEAYCGPNEVRTTAPAEALLPEAYRGPNEVRTTAPAEAPASDAAPQEPSETELPSQDSQNSQDSQDSQNSQAAEDDDRKTVVVDPDSPYGLDGKKIFNPDPTRAVWLSALCPGLGQIYNRRYWKLPIVVGGFMGLLYATNWNNNQYADYSQAFRDLTDSDPDSRSYMNFFPPTTVESDLDLNWLTSVMQSRKNYYRRNRDLCIICMVGLYLLCMVDAYVDASMAHFDISPDLSLDLTPALMLNPVDRRVNLGLNWAFTF